VRAAYVMTLSFVVTACGGGGGGGGGGAGSGAPTYPVAVDVRGYADTGLVLLNNGADALTVGGDGRHTFGRALTASSPYSISVQQQPFAQVCVPTNGAGVVDANTPPIIAIECLNRVVGAATGLWIVTRAAAGGVEQLLYARSRTTDLNHFRIRSIDGGLDAAGPIWSPLPTNNFIISFEFTPDGSSVYADNALGDIHAAALRDSDGAVLSSWSGVLGTYVPRPPVLFGFARLSPDGQALYQNFDAVIGGIRYRDLWIASVGPLGLSVLSGSPFPLDTEGGIHFEPSGRFFARAAPNTIEVYRAFSATMQTPQLLGSYPRAMSSAFGFLGEEKPSRFLYEPRIVIVTGAQSASPQFAVHRWRTDGTLESLGAPLTGVPVTGEIANAVCSNGVTTTQRVAALTLLQATAAEHRYVIEGQDTRCQNLGPGLGPIADSRVLAVYLLRVANAQSELVQLRVDTLPGWTDLGVSGAAHPSKPWLYVGSKFSQRIYGYAVDSSTGGIQPLPGSPFDSFSLPSAGGASQPVVLVDPAGKYLYLTRYPESQPRLVHAFSIHQTTGALTAVATYPLP
jgi:hypothetical protein